MTTFTPYRLHQLRRRKKLFQAVLVLSGESQNAWARRHGVGKTQLSLVLDGKRVSQRLTSLVDAYIAEAQSCFQRHCQVAA